MADYGKVSRQRGQEFPGDVTHCNRYTTLDAVVGEDWPGEGSSAQEEV